MHTLQEDFDHFLSYSGLWSEPEDTKKKLMVAYEANWTEIEQAKTLLSKLLLAVYPEMYPLQTLLGLVSQVDNGLAVPLAAAQQGHGTDVLPMQNNQ